ncbi:MAG: trypsin-like peptidase domain-containing protein [Verrucomicrobiota bacterium]|nr:trypsin-like peptidase domain-containing protein [Limisphaera sp.]MDW8382663.1 trypsin-like peptidase domain-containing protein [Verrucomicrobiota bacterium]
MAWLSALPADEAHAAAADEADLRRDATVRAIERALPTVVNIATTRIVEYRDPYQDLFYQFYGRRAPVERREEPSSIGSGVIIDEEGYILTNFHVLRRASRVYVKLQDGRVLEAEPLVYTPHKDVALIKVSLPREERLPAIAFAGDDDLILGETVIALGNPYGLGTSASRGILSSKARRPPVEGEPLGTQDWLQTDAGINPGNSGGPLINLRGELIGINVAVYREHQGMGVGFAIPVKQVNEALSEFFSPEVTSALWFGARVKGLHGPLMITSVQPGSPAARAALQEGMAIESVDGSRVRGLVEWNRRMTEAGERSVRLGVRLGGSRRTAEVQLVAFDSLVQQKLGLRLLQPTPQVAAAFQVNPGEGLFIESVEPRGPADRAGIPARSLLVGVEGQAVGSLFQVVELLVPKSSGERVRLTLLVPRRLGVNYVEYRQVTMEVTLR